MASIGQGLVWLLRKAAGLAPPRWMNGFCTVVAVCSVRAYQLCLSRVSGRRCMFRLGCSSYALEQLDAHGWSDGKSAIVARLDQCNGHYVMSFDGRGCMMTTSDGHVHEESQISSWLLAKYKTDHAQLIQRLASGPV